MANKIVFNPFTSKFDYINQELPQSLYFYGKASGAISKGDLLQFAGVQGDHILMKKCVVADIQANPTYFIGVANQDLSNGEFGYSTWFGEVDGLYTDTPDNQDTADWVVGDILYFSNTTGQLTNTAPTAPDAYIEVAAVEKVQTGASQTGRIIVRPTIHHKLNKLSDVYAPNPTNNQVIAWNSTNSRWESATVTGVNGVTYHGEHDTDPAVSPSNGDEYWNNLDQRMQVYINEWRELNGADRFQFTDDSDFQFTDDSYYQLTS